MPGAAPQKSARRANARPDWVTLPAEGRSGPPPKWPLEGRMPVGVKAMWTFLWATPQATEWERLHLVRVVARYVQSLLEAEKPAADTSILGETRQLEDRLGMSPMAMKRLQWELPAALPSGSAVEVTSLATYRDL